MATILSIDPGAQPATRPDLQRRYYRPLEVVKITGASKSVVYEALEGGRLRGYKVGPSWFVPVDAVDDWIQGISA